MFPLARASTVDLIATELRAAIFSGALPIGSALREVEISSQLGVSRSPLREAAQRLVQEGLLTAVPGRGLKVTRIPAEHVADVYVARLAVEAQAVRVLAAALGEAAESGAPTTGVIELPAIASLTAVETAFFELVRASKGGDAWEIGDADIAFHQTLVDAAGSPRLSRMMTTLAVETRIAALSALEGYSVRRSVSPTYRQLIEALREGRAEAAIAALQQQFDDAVRRLNGEDDTVDTVETETEHEPQQFEPLSTDGLEG